MDDFLLENDKIRVVIHGRASDTGSTTTFGATILDADVQRPQAQFAGGNGEDRLFEVAPMVSLGVLRPESTSFEVVRPVANEEGGALPLGGRSLRSDSPRAAVRSS